LIANPFATGVAEATVASDDVPATNTIVATTFIKRLAILLSPGGVALRRTILWRDGGSMRDPLRTGCIRDASKRQISSALWICEGIGRSKWVGRPRRQALFEANGVRAIW
jgi:hypothetical protein